MRNGAGVMVVGLVGLALACGSGGGSSSSSGASDVRCRMEMSVSGGAGDRRLDAESQACATSSSSVSFAGLDAELVVSMSIQKLDKVGQTGRFSATVGIGIEKGKVRWDGAACNVDITSNVPDSSFSDAGPGEGALVRGTGTCDTPATYRSDAGAKDPVQIAPFSFVFATKLY